MTTREQNIETIRAACIAANPERKNRNAYASYSQDGFQVEAYYEDTTTRLADVLLAMNYSFLVDTHGVFWRWDMWHTPPHATTGIWNLRKDSLTAQSDETLAFLSELLADKS